MHTNHIPRRRGASGYSLVEVVVASCVLLIGVGAACILSLTMIGQEETHQRVARGANLIENATRLYQLGLSSSEVLALLPPDPMVKSFTASAQGTTPLAFGAPQYVAWTLDFYPVPGDDTWTPGTWGGSPDTSVPANQDYRRMGPIKSYRTSVRP